jgi:cytochrome b561
MALLVLMMIPAGLIMVQQGIARSLQDTLFLFHKNFGVLLFLLVAGRLIYRWRSPPPPLPDTLPGWQQRISHISHGVLYLLLVVMPVAGYVRVRAGGFPIESLDALGISSLIPRSEELANAAKAVHYYGGLAIAAVILLHIGAALHHGLILRDGIFGRMWPPFGSDDNRG